MGNRIGPSEPFRRRRSANPGSRSPDLSVSKKKRRETPKPVPSRNVRRDHGLAVAVLLLTGSLLYGLSFGIPFLWDDQHLILENRFLQSWACLPKLFGPDFYREVFFQSYYRPLQGVSLLLDYQLWGDHPFGYHLTSLLFHLSNGLLVYALGLLLLGASLPALAAGLVFLLHPIQVQAVGYISGRADPMAVFGVLCSTLAWWRFRASAGRPAFRWYAAALVSGLAAWLSKESSVILPLLWVLLDSTVLGPRGIPVRWKAYAPVAILLAGYLAVRMSLGSQGPGLTGSGAWLTGPKNLLTTLRIFLFPYDLHMERRMPEVSSWADPALWIGLALVGVLGWAVLRLRSHKAVLFGAGWFLVGWLPVSGLLIRLDPNMADHWLYLPSVGLSLLVGWAVSRGTTPPGRRAAVLAVIGLLGVGLAALSAYRIWIWSDPVRLYTDALRWPPGSATAHNNLGNIWLSRGQAGRAMDHYLQALSLKPRYAEARNNLGSAYERMGQIEKAREQFRRALEVNPGFTQASLNLVRLDLRLGRLEEAGRRLEGIRPAGPKEQVRWLEATAEVLIRQGREEEAERKLREALKSHPHRVEFLNLLGIALRRQRKASEAALVLTQAIAVLPTEPSLWVNLGNAYRDLGRNREAAQAYRRALELDPRYPEARSALDELPKS